MPQGFPQGQIIDNFELNYNKNLINFDKYVLIEVTLWGLPLGKKYWVLIS